LAATLQPLEASTLFTPHDAQRIRKMAAFYFASFWCILFTGAVRKWIFPHVAILYLFQDVPLTFAYLYALWSGLFTRGYILIGSLILAMVLVLQGLLQIINSTNTIFVAVVGFHHYLFYLPMLVVFPLCLIEKYRRDFIRWNLWISLPMTLLVVAQAVSPKNSFVNRTSEGDAFGLPGVEVARVSGTFNFVAFFAIWVSMAVALCMGEWLLPRERRVIHRTWLLILCTFGLVLSSLISGSRTIILLVVIALLGALVAAIILGSGRAVAAIIGLCLVLPIAGAATYFISPVEFDTVRERLTGESGAQNSKARVLDVFYTFLLEPKFSLIGAGIGMGVDASHFGNAETYNFTYELSEQDVTRNVMELGTPLGISYVFLRIGFLFGMILLAVRIVRKGTSPHVLPLSFILFAQGMSDLTRAATMTASQVMIGEAYILGAFMYADQYALQISGFVSASGPFLSPSDPSDN
jgi:hypothetical protein